MAKRYSRTGDSQVDSWIEKELQYTANRLHAVMTSSPYHYGVGVDTGALRDSITIEKKGDDYYVGVDEDLLVNDPRNERGRNYAKYHHSYYDFLDVAVEIASGGSG